VNNENISEYFVETNDSLKEILLKVLLSRLFETSLIVVLSKEVNE